MVSNLFAIKQHGTPKRPFAGHSSGYGYRSATVLPRSWAFGNYSVVISHSRIRAAPRLKTGCIERKLTAAFCIFCYESLVIHYSCEVPALPFPAIGHNWAPCLEASLLKLMTAAASSLTAPSFPVLLCSTFCLLTPSPISSNSCCVCSCSPRYSVFFYPPANHEDLFRRSTSTRSTV